MAVYKCNHCGETVGKNAIYCSHCGGKLDEDKENLLVKDEILAGGLLVRTPKGKLLFEKNKCIDIEARFLENEDILKLLEESYKITYFDINSYGVDIKFFYCKSGEDNQLCLRTVPLNLAKDIQNKFDEKIIDTVRISHTYKDYKLLQDYFNSLNPEILLKLELGD